MINQDLTQSIQETMQQLQELQQAIQIGDQDKIEQLQNGLQEKQQVIPDKIYQAILAGSTNNHQVDHNGSDGPYVEVDPDDVDEMIDSMYTPGGFDYNDYRSDGSGN